MAQEIDIHPLLTARGDSLADLFSGWRENPPDMRALVTAAVRHFGIPRREHYLADVFNAAAAADVPLNNPYHNNDHFREVTAVMLGLMHEHNKSFEPKLDGKDLCKCLIAAAAHDLGHKGRPNAHAFEMEDIAISMLAGRVSLNAEDFEDIRHMIRATDIGRYPDQEPPAPPRTEKLRAMTEMLCDADVIPSSATTYAFSTRMAEQLSHETPIVQPTPKNLVNFMEYVIGPHYQSKAARKLHGQSMRSLRAEARRLSAKI